MHSPMYAGLYIKCVLLMARLSNTRPAGVKILIVCKTWNVHGMEWTRGMDPWNGLVEWTRGMDDL